jgi:protein-tyrosine phosphatase
VIDLHSHILPGIDDGPDYLEGSLALARAAVAAGTTTIAATPHIDSRLGLRPTDRDAPLAALRAALDEQHVGLTVVAGGEIALERYLELTPEELDLLRLGDGPFLLLECPLSQAAGGFDRFLSTLLSRGVRMLLAHPERCPDFQRRPDRLADLVRSGALAQVTSASLSGRFGRTVQGAALHMLSEGLVHDLSSDAHDAAVRGPDLREGLEAAERALPGAAALADWLAVDVPRAILDGSPTPRRPAVVLTAAPRRRGLFRRRQG